MKTNVRIFIVLACVILSPSMVFAGPSITFTNGKWETTFNYPACQQRGGAGAPTVDCANVANDNIYWSYGAGAVDGHYTENSAAANNPSGGGGNGLRQWIGSNNGDNYNTAPVRISFPTPQKELWIRWYERYESGFKWTKAGGAAAKSLYFRAVDPITSYAIQAGSCYVYLAYSDVIRVYNQGGWDSGEPSVGPYAETGGWNTWYPGGTSNGTWHRVEVYLKMDTTRPPSANGVGKIWVDGVLVASDSAVDWSDGDATALGGWAYFEFLSNKKDPGLARTYYADIDDMVIYNTTPPNKDAQGNPFIGPIAGSVSAPKGLIFTSKTP